MKTPSYKNSNPTPQLYMPSARSACRKYFVHDELHRACVMQSLSHGAYTQVTNKREVLTHTTTSKFRVVHFFHKDFSRCKIMDSHLEVLARKHFDTKFTSIDDANGLRGRHLCLHIGPWQSFSIAPRTRMLVASPTPLSKRSLVL